MRFTVLVIVFLMAQGVLADPTSTTTVDSKKSSIFGDLWFNLKTRFSDSIESLHQSTISPKPFLQEVKLQSFRAITPTTGSEGVADARANEILNNTKTAIRENEENFQNKKIDRSKAGSPFSQLIAQELGGSREVPSKNAITFKRDLFYFNYGPSGGIITRQLDFPNKDGVSGPVSILGFSDRYIYFQRTPDSIIQWDLTNKNVKENTKSIPLGGVLTGFSVWGENFYAVVNGVGLVSMDEGLRKGKILLLGGNKFLKEGVEFSSNGVIVMEADLVYRIDFRTDKVYPMTFDTFAGKSITGFFIDQKNILHLFYGNVDEVYDLSNNHPTKIDSQIIDTRGKIIFSAKREGSDLIAYDKDKMFITSVRLSDGVLPQNILGAGNCPVDMDELGNKKLQDYRADFRRRAQEHQQDLNPPAEDFSGSILHLTN